MPIQRICLVCHKPIKVTKNKVKTVCQCNQKSPVSGVESTPLDTLPTSAKKIQKSEATTSQSTVK